MKQAARSHTASAGVYGCRVLRNVLSPVPIASFMNEHNFNAIPRYSEGASLFRAKYRIASMRSHLVRLPSNTFASEFQGKIKTAVSKFLNALEQELIGIDAYMDELSEKIEPYIDEIVSDYGLKCVKFSLAGLDIDTTKYDVIDASQIELIARSRGYQGDKAGLDILGSDWGRIQGAGILRDLANNPGAGGVAAAGAGMGMGIGAAGAFGSIAQQVFAPAQNGFAPQQPTNPTQNAPSGRFTQKNSASVTPAVNAEDPMETLGKLKKLLDAGLIEQAEYDAKKTEILSRM